MTATSRDIAREIWQAGFDASAEGWNSEWPFGAPKRQWPEQALEEHARLEDQFNEFYQEWCSNPGRLMLEVGGRTCVAPVHVDGRSGLAVYEFSHIEWDDADD